MGFDSDLNKLSFIPVSKKFVAEFGRQLRKAFGLGSIWAFVDVRGL